LSIEEQYEELLDRDIELQPEQQRFTIDSLDKADWAIRKIIRHQKLIDEAKAFVADRIDELDRFLEDVETSNGIEIVNFQSMLRPWIAEQLAGGRKKSVALPSGTVSLRSRDPEFFVNGIKVTAKNKQLTENVKKFAPEFIKIEEYTDWAGLKETLTVTKLGHVVNSDGEILNWITGAERDDVINVKGRG